MREIEFKGKRDDNGEWVYGYYWSNECGNYFIKEKWTLVDFEVSEETIGQYTGLKDKNGTKIFEGDIIVVGNDKGPRFRYITEWLERSANYLARQNGTTGYIGTGYGFDEWEVIGNIHDNPELLELD